MGQPQHPSQRYTLQHHSRIPSSFLLIPYHQDDPKNVPPVATDSYATAAAHQTSHVHIAIHSAESRCASHITAVRKPEKMAVSGGGEEEGRERRAEFERQGSIRSREGGREPPPEGVGLEEP